MMNAVFWWDTAWSGAVSRPGSLNDRVRLSILCASAKGTSPQQDFSFLTMSLGERAFKKAIRSKEHRERAQPERRAKLGLLEKKRDYVERARDYHRKEDRLKALRLRASQRNPDEFYFGMIRARQIVR